MLVTMALVEARGVGVGWRQAAGKWEGKTLLLGSLLLGSLGLEGTLGPSAFFFCFFCFGDPILQGC